MEDSVSDQLSGLRATTDLAISWSVILHSEPTIGLLCHHPHIVWLYTVHTKYGFCQCQLGVYAHGLEFAAWADMEYV